MGTVLRRVPLPVLLVHRQCFSPLLDGDGVASTPRCGAGPLMVSFQSPSRWGRCCVESGAITLTSAPTRFSPLLDGDGVASMVSPSHSSAQFLGFSPLLDGDGVASAKIHPYPYESWMFQSPSRWGRCCVKTDCAAR